MARLRANPDYELVLVDRLAGAEREALRGEIDGDLYGVLRPRRGSELRLRAASPDTALLFLTLGQPAALPEYARRQLGADAERELGRLVLDGVLEVEHCGMFVCGAQAGELVFGAADARVAGDVAAGKTVHDDRARAGGGRIGELSRAALAYTAELAAGGLREDQLVQRLYAYGGRPLTPVVQRRLCDPTAIETLLGIDADGAARRSLDAHWRRVAPPAGERAQWQSWLARGRSGHARAGYKLYVSPDIDGVGVAFAALAGLLGPGRGAFAFKVGAGVDGLCRPDKLVAYFERLDDLQVGAALLRAELAGCPAQGVPFTAAVTDDGLLSWGADPPGLVGTSWRGWVCERLVEYLSVGGVGELEAARFALQRLRLAGVDTDTWIPASRMWADALAGA